jgi:hypothetical protein
MHVSIFGVVICSVQLMAWGVLRLGPARSGTEVIPAGHSRRTKQAGP